MSSDLKDLRELWENSLKHIYPDLEKSQDIASAFLLGYEYLLHLYNNLPPFSCQDHVFVYTQLKKFQELKSTSYEQKIAEEI